MRPEDLRRYVRNTEKTVVPGTVAMRVQGMGVLRTLPRRLQQSIQASRADGAQRRHGVRRGMEKWVTTDRRAAPTQDRRQALAARAAALAATPVEEKPAAVSTAGGREPLFTTEEPKNA